MEKIAFFAKAILFFMAFSNATLAMETQKLLSSNSLLIDKALKKIKKLENLYEKEKEKNYRLQADNGTVVFDDNQQRLLWEYKARNQEPVIADILDIVNQINQSQNDQIEVKFIPRIFKGKPDYDDFPMCGRDFMSWHWSLLCYYGFGEYDPIYFVVDTKKLREKLEMLE